MLFWCVGVQDTQQLATELARLLPTNAVIALNGPMGAGKTAFAQGLAQGLGVAAQVTSPTFLLVQEYQGRCGFFHFDVYRLSGAEEFYAMGGDEYFQRGVCAVEWAERIPEVLSEDCLHVTLEPCDTGRTVAIEWPKHEDILDTLQQRCGHMLQVPGVSI